MTVKELIEKNIFQLVNEGENLNQEITDPYCCDLLSVAMGKAPRGAVWVTVMANMNTLAVAALTDVACIILAEGVLPDEQTVNKAKEQGITVLAAGEPVFETSLQIYQLLNA
jgi:serine kinase of HPr protein (carbohydrate metabolism regulator)